MCVCVFSCFEFECVQAESKASCELRAPANLILAQACAGCFTGGDGDGGGFLVAWRRRKGIRDYLARSTNSTLFACTINTHNMAAAVSSTSRGKNFPTKQLLLQLTLRLSLNSASILQIRLCVCLAANFSFFAVFSRSLCVCV